MQAIVRTHIYIVFFTFFIRNNNERKKNDKIKETKKAKQKYIFKKNKKEVKDQIDKKNTPLLFALFVFILNKILFVCTELYLFENTRSKPRQREREREEKRKRVRSWAKFVALVFQTF